MSSLSLMAFGDNGDTAARRRRINDRRDAAKLGAAERRRADAKKPSARLSTEEYTKLLKVAATRSIGPEKCAAAADAHTILIASVVRCPSSGFVAIAPRPESAARLAAWMRSPGVNAFCTALQRLDEISGAPAPVGRPVDMAPSLLVEAAERLEAVEGSAAEDALAAARHLRTAGIHSALARIFVTPETAGPLADALHAVGASRFTVNRLDTIAGRAGFRPLA